MTTDQLIALFVLILVYGACLFAFDRLYDYLFFGKWPRQRAFIRVKVARLIKVFISILGPWAQSLRLRGRNKRGGGL